MPRKTRLQISLTDKQIEELEKLAKEKGFTKSAILALALEEYSRKELEQKNSEILSRKEWISLHTN